MLFECTLRTIECQLSSSSVSSVFKNIKVRLWKNITQNLLIIPAKSEKGFKTLKKHFKSQWLPKIYLSIFHVRHWRQRIDTINTDKRSECLYYMDLTFEYILKYLPAVIEGQWEQTKHKSFGSFLSIVPQKNHAFKNAIKRQF